MSSLESSAASDIWRNTSRTEAQNCISLMAFLLGNTGKKNILPAKLSSTSCCVCPSWELLAPLAPPAGWHRVSPDRAALMPVPTAPTATLSWKPQAVLLSLPTPQWHQVSGDLSDTPETATFLPFFRLTQSTWAFIHVLSTALFLASWLLLTVLYNFVIPLNLNKNRPTFKQILQNTIPSMQVEINL